MYKMYMLQCLVQFALGVNCILGLSDDLLFKMDGFDDTTKAVVKFNVLNLGCFHLALSGIFCTIAANGASRGQNVAVGIGYWALGALYVWAFQTNMIPASVAQTQIFGQDASPYLVYGVYNLACGICFLMGKGATAAKSKTN